MATLVSPAHAVGAGCSGTIAHLWTDEDGSVNIRLALAPSTSCGCAVTYTLEGPTYYVFKEAGTVVAGVAETHATALAAKIANKTVQVWYEETGTETGACTIHNVALLTQ
jgi:hypothetical protein